MPTRISISEPDIYGGRSTTIYFATPENGKIIRATVERAATKWGTDITESKFKGDPAEGFEPDPPSDAEIIDEMASRILFERIRAGTDRPDYLVVSHDYGRAIAEECYSIAREMHKRSAKGLAGVSQVEIKE